MRAIALEEIQVASDEDTCLARTRTALHRKRWKNFLDNAKALNPPDCMFMTGLEGAQ